VILQAQPEVLNHNTETVPRLWCVLKETMSGQWNAKRARDSAPVYTKSGLMVGLGETEAEIRAVMQDLRAVDCDILTLGQYLQPSQKTLASRYLVPEQLLLEAVWRVLRIPPGGVLTSNPQLLSCRAGEGINANLPRSRF